MSKFGECEGYNGKECVECGRFRVLHYSNGYDICEKCSWCPQIKNYVSDEDFMNEEVENE